MAAWAGGVILLMKGEGSRRPGVLAGPLICGGKEMGRHGWRRRLVAAPNRPALAASEKLRSLHQPPHPHSHTGYLQLDRLMRRRKRAAPLPSGEPAGEASAEVTALLLLPSALLGSSLLSSRQPGLGAIAPGGREGSAKRSAQVGTLGQPLPN